MECPPLQDVLATAKEAVLLAGDQIRGAVQKQRRADVADTKSSSVDLVTETDRRCEELILGHIRQRWPEHQIIGEESSGSCRYELTEGPTWVVDPIDGTTNFVHRLALSCVLVAFIHRKEVVASVTYDPASQEMFWATRGGGAFMSRGGAGAGAPAEKLQASSTASLAKAVVSMDPGYGRSEPQVARFEAVVGGVMRRSARGLRIMGCTGLCMAWVACGRLDAGFEEGRWDANTGPKIWDFSAGKLLIEEAGGVTRDCARAAEGGGHSLDLLGRSSFFAATPELAEELLSVLRSAAGTGAGGAGGTKRPLPKE